MRRSWGSRGSEALKRFVRRTVLVVVLILVLDLGVGGSNAPTMLGLAGGSDVAPADVGSVDEAAATAPPSIVLILSDDQRWDTLWAMPTVRSLIARHGVTFSSTFVANPVCCPSRSSILTGAYSHTTGVYSNHANHGYGGFKAFDDGTTIATELQAAGYRTGLFGKYLNGYKSTYIPPGWDRWFVTFGEAGYYDYEASANGRMVGYGSDPSDYGTRVVGDRVVSFIRSTGAEQPLFAFFAPHAPHAPATPAPGDAHAFSSLRPWRPRSYDEVDVSDKPGWVREIPRLGSKSAGIDRFRLDQYRSLLELDRTVGRIVDVLDETGRLATTMIVFASDNGMMWGEHRVSGKGDAFEESLHVPLVVRYDPLTGAPRTDDHLISNIDLAPTFADLVGVRLPGAEGRSLVPLLSGGSASWRRALLVEHVGPSGGHFPPTFCAVHEERYVYVSYATGERELYDLRADRLELVNRAGTLGGGPVGRRLRSELHRLCDPGLPGLSA
jgi:arylsulfatase A-like enzyme